MENCPLCGRSFSDVASLERHVNQCLDQKETRHDEDLASALMQAEDENSAISDPFHSSADSLSSRHWSLQRQPVEKYGYVSDAAVRSAASASRREASRDTLKILNHRLNLLRQTKDAYVALRADEMDPHLDSALVDIYSVAIHEYMGFSASASVGKSHEPAGSGLGAPGSNSPLTAFDSGKNAIISNVTQVEASIIDKAWMRSLRANLAHASTDELEMLMSGHFNAVFTMGTAHPLGIEFGSFQATWFEPYQRIAEPTSAILSQITSSIHQSCHRLVQSCREYYSSLFGDTSLNSITLSSLQSALDLAVSAAVYNCVYPQFYDLIRRVCWAEDKVHAAKMEELRLLPLQLSQLSLSKSVEQLNLVEPLQKCSAALRTIQSVVVPTQKLRIIVDVLRQIARSAGPYSLAADDLVPLFCYVVVYANVPDLYSQSAFIERFASDQSGYGESGYALATLQAALAGICLMDHKVLQTPKGSNLKPTPAPIKISVAELDDEEEEYVPMSDGIRLSTFST
eukprot:TRINITY_DN2856_c0_g1_i1.p1 TRINITY_DN2856_c0_g1~~TRINITY_DN2856_c0_g1_i1.p1  ORF type:complete len:513 (+),score=69.16 TRINITY_DN2856_c0_g1_i1:85-1623(+)